MHEPELPRPCAVVPVYNHEGAVPAVVHALRAQDLPVFLIDDGCAADCAALLRSLASADDGVTLVALERNSGKGAAVLHGCRCALAAGYTHALQIDADGQHDADAIPQALTLMRASPRALIAGVPRFDGSIPAARFYGRYLTHFFVALHTWSLGLRDALCGFRVYPLVETVALANRHRIAQRMDFDIDIGVRLSWDRVPVRSVPVKVSYPRDGVSHFNMRLDNLRITRVHAVLLCGMLLRAPQLLVRLIQRCFSRARS